MGARSIKTCGFGFQALAALVLLVVMICAAPAARAQVEAMPRAEGEQAAPSASPRNDLAPRPLGLPRDNKQAAQSQTARDPLAWTKSPLMRTILALAGVLSLVGGLAAVAKRLAKSNPNFAAAFGGGGRAPAGILEVLGRYPLGRGQTLVLLKLDRRVLLLSQAAPRLRSGPGSVATLAEISDPEDVASILLKVQEAEGNTSADRFRSILERFDGDHQREGDGVVDVPSSLRHVQNGQDGDRAELWDDQAVPPEHVTAVRTDEPRQAPSASAPAEVHEDVFPPAPTLRIAGVDAYAELRSRLSHARTHFGAFNAGGRR